MLTRLVCTQGKDKLYGEHPWNWYFSQGFPSIVGTALPPAIAGYLTVPVRSIDQSKRNGETEFLIRSCFALQSTKKDLGYIVLWSLFIYSNAPHKGMSIDRLRALQASPDDIEWYALTEFRFVLPLLPPTLVYAGYCLRNLENRLYVQFRERTQRNLLFAAVFSLIVPNVAASYYLSRTHQVGLRGILIYPRQLKS